MGHFSNTNTSEIVSLNKRTNILSSKSKAQKKKKKRKKKRTMLPRVLRNQLKCWWTGNQWKLRLNITYTIQTLSLVSRHYCSSKKNYIYKKKSIQKPIQGIISICTSKVRRLHNNGLQPGHSFSTLINVNQFDRLLLLRCNKDGSIRTGISKEY